MSFCAAWTGERLAVLDDQVRAELGHVFPSLWALTDGREVALQHERHRSHRAVRQLLEQLAEPRPLVLVLDDVHWADAASVELLGALLRRPPAAVLIALGMRSGQTSERLSGPLERAYREGVLTPIELRALSAEEARELLGETVDAAAAAGAVRGERRQPVLPPAARPVTRHRTSGQARSRCPSGRHRRACRGRRVVERGVAQLSEAGRLVLEGAAVAGDPFEPELAAASAATSETACDRRHRRALGARSGPLDRRPPPLPLPAPARSTRGLRSHPRRLAAGCPPTMRPAARRAWGDGGRARPPRGALSPRGRPRRGRDPARGR